MDEQGDVDGNRDDRTAAPDMRLPDVERQPWRPSRRQVIAGGILLGVLVVLLNATRFYLRAVADCDLPLWVYCINCPRLSELPATLDTWQVGPYTAVELYGGYTSEAVYFNAAGRLIAAKVSSDTNEYCRRTEHSRWFGQRFSASAEPYPPNDAYNTRPRWAFEKFPTPQGADHWR